MQTETYFVAAAGDFPLFVHRWLPEGPVRAVVQIAHGLSEHAGRYSGFAAALTDAGYAVFAADHRGHGRSVTGAAQLGHVANTGGWDSLLADMKTLADHCLAQHAGRPLFLFGHSMGSFLTQCFIARHGKVLNGAILSASSGRPPPIAVLGRIIARLERLRLGAIGRSNLLQKLSFGEFNKRFQPSRTAFDWLSRDAAEVDRYIADPLCGAPASTATWIALLDGIAEAARPEVQAAIPRRLPLFTITGTHDPVSAGGKGVRQLLKTWDELGIEDVGCRFYEGARHELLNETNREEVIADVLVFLDRVTAKTMDRRSAAI